MPHAARRQAEGKGKS